MPERCRTEPALCDHRVAPWYPLCEHAGSSAASSLNEGDVGRRIETTKGAGVLTAVRHLDDVLTQVVLEHPDGQGGAVIADLPAGEVVRMGWPRP